MSTTKKIHYDGNVGIGNSNPVEKLEVEGNIKVGRSKTICANRGMLTFSDVVEDKNHAIYNNGVNVDNEGSWDGMKFNIYEGASFRVGDANQNKPTEALLINSTGQISIGANSTHSNFKMQVKGGSGKWKGGIAAGGENVNVVLGEVDKLAFIGGHNSTCNAWSDLTINAHGGNVGIGTEYNAPTEKLEVNGKIKCTEILQVSDGRLKNIVAPIQNALKKIMSLKGITYQWKDTAKGEKVEMGLIAQDVENIFPEVVTNDNEGNKSIAYSKMVAPLIEAIKEQQLQIEALKKEVSLLKSCSPQMH